MTLTFRDRVAAFFEAHPDQWIDGLVIAQIGGCYASRTRISECRQQLHMSIENRVRRIGRRAVSEYRYTPPAQPEQARLEMSL